MLRVTDTRMVFAGLVTLAIVSCSSWNSEDACVSEQEYQNARSIPPLSVPEGLDRPDSLAALTVPDAPAPVEPLSRNAECLQRPPSYFQKAAKPPAN